VLNSKSYYTYPYALCQPDFSKSNDLFPGVFLL